MQQILHSSPSGSELVLLVALHNVLFSPLNRCWLIPSLFSNLLWFGSWSLRMFVFPLAFVQTEGGHYLCGLS